MTENQTGVQTRTTGGALQCPLFFCPDGLPCLKSTAGQRNGPGTVLKRRSYLYLTDTSQGPAGLSRPESISTSRQTRRESILARLRQAQPTSDDRRLVDYEATIDQSLKLSGPEFNSSFQLDQESGDLRMRYACVPAGILILEPVPGRSVGDLRTQVAPIIRRHVPAGRSTELTITIQQAEDRCAQVR